MKKFTESQLEYYDEIMEIIREQTTYYSGFSAKRNIHILQHLHGCELALSEWLNDQFSERDTDEIMCSIRHIVGTPFLRDREHCFDEVFQTGERKRSVPKTNEEWTIKNLKELMPRFKRHIESKDPDTYETVALLGNIYAELTEERLEFYRGIDKIVLEKNSFENRFEEKSEKVFKNDVKL